MKNTTYKTRATIIVDEATNEKAPFQVIIEKVCNEKTPWQDVYLVRESWLETFEDAFTYARAFADYSEIVC